MSADWGICCGITRRIFVGDDMTEINELVKMGMVEEFTNKCPFHEDHDCKDSARNDLERHENPSFGANVQNGVSTVLRTDAKGEQYKVPSAQRNPRRHLSNMKVKIAGKSHGVGFQAHHLIPVSVIKRHQIRLMLKTGTRFNLCCNVGYGVNGSENGVWLPAMHEVGEWSSWTEQTQMQYMVAASKVLEGATISKKEREYEFKSPRQFHMTHKDYLSFVTGQLTKHCTDINDKTSKCPTCNPKQGNAPEKNKPPIRLLGVLNALSFRLRGYLVGRVVHKTVYTHKFGKEMYKDRHTLGV
jgi:hypothetical protein